jgi:hypothetical protein
MLLDLNVQATSRLGLEPIKGADGQYLYGGIVPAVITDVHLGIQKHTKGEFKDMDVPVLQVELENFKLTDKDVDRFHTHTFKLVGTKQLVQNTQDQYETRKVEDVNNDTTDLWKSIKHFLESLSGSPNYRNIANISKEDSLKYLDLPGSEIPAADRIAKYKAFFEYIIKFVVGDATLKSQVLDAEGKPLPIWVKMLPNYDRDSKRNAKFYSIPRFINQGVFEPMKVDKGIPVGRPLIIRIKATESLALIATTGAAPVAGAPSNSATPGNISPEVANLLK